MALFDSLKNLFKSKPGTPSAKKKQVPVVDVAKRFELLGRTGQGSMSKVYRARDSKIGRIVCLKILDRLKTEKFNARFPGLVRPTEGEIGMLMRHKNIVQTFEHGLTTEGEEYIVMELIDGVGLNFLVETKSRQLEGNRVNYLRQLAEGLEHMHKTGFLHRDICPRNVMVTNDGVVKIIDLGLSIPYKPEFCRPGNRTGTTFYLAPELVKRQPTDHRVDMFALGVTAYEVFTGTLPWEKATSLQVLLNLMNSPGRDPREVVPTLDEEIVKFLKKAIERDPRDRFQNPEQFRAALAELPEV
ncbi:MAG: serine/threonine protein kinase [Gemmataceae bacterium]|nr:serine/threonine protein kinase [Gemmataceae bacterium]